MQIYGGLSIIKQKVFERDLSRVGYAISGSLPVKLPVKKNSEFFIDSKEPPLNFRGDYWGGHFNLALNFIAQNREKRPLVF